MKEYYPFDHTFNNIIFEGRNKLYGAYYLRQIYAKHIKHAVIIATTILTAGASGLMVKTDRQEENTYKNNFPAVDLGETVILPPPPPREKLQDPIRQEQQPKQKIATIAYTETKVVKEDVPAEAEVPSQDELINKAIGEINQEGIDLTGIDVVDIKEGIENESNREPSTPFEIVEQMPMFEGGESALIKYLSKNLRYPAPAKQQEVQGLVVVTFVVGVNGEIKDAHVLKGLGYGTDEEAKRVIESMPNWIPGKQNNKAVPVRFTLPIRFNLQR